MKSLLFLALPIVSLFASDRGQDIDTILNESLFKKTPNGSLIEMLAMNAIQGEEKSLDNAILLEKFYELHSQGAYKEKFQEAYASFTDDEIHEISTIMQNPVFKKYSSEEGYRVFFTLADLIGNEMKAIVRDFGTEKKPEAIEEIESNFTIIEITKENFYNEVILSKKPIVIDFYNDHCGPCKLLKPVFAELNAKHGGDIQFASVDTAKEEEIVKHFGIRGVPTIIFLKPDRIWPEVAKTKVGFKNKEEIVQEFDEFVKGL